MGPGEGNLGMGICVPIILAQAPGDGQLGAPSPAHPRPQHRWPCHVSLFLALLGQTQNLSQIPYLILFSGKL